MLTFSSDLTRVTPKHRSTQLSIVERCTADRQAVRDSWFLYKAAKAGFLGEHAQEYRLDHQLPDDLVTALSTAGLFLHTRLCDLDHRAYVELMYYVLGDHHCRAHDASLWVYQAAGFWEYFGGIFPEAVLKYVADIMMVAEGLIRVVPDAKKNLAAIYTHAFSTFAGKHRHDCMAFTCWCMDQAVAYAKPSAQEAAPDIAWPEHEGPAAGAPPQADDLPRGDVAGAPGDGAADDAGKGAKTWQDRMAEVTQKCGSRFRLMLASSHARLISMFNEWCSTPMRPAKGVVYRDIVIIYDKDGQPVTYCRTASCYDNIYRGIDQNLITLPDNATVLAELGHVIDPAILRGVDPAFNAVLERVIDIYAMTFWANDVAYDLHFSFYALASRGYNIDMMVVYMGSGGVGLSLLTGHLAAAEGDRNHNFFDPNILINDDDLKK